MTHAWTREWSAAFSLEINTPRRDDDVRGCARRLERRVALREVGIVVDLDPHSDKSSELNGTSPNCIVKKWSWTSLEMETSFVPKRDARLSTFVGRCHFDAASASPGEFRLRPSSAHRAPRRIQPRHARRDLECVRARISLSPPVIHLGTQDIASPS